jgi:SET domain-containing protein
MKKMRSLRKHIPVYVRTQGSWFCIDAIQIKLNCMAIHSLEHEYLGIGLDPLASLINHSCKPNADCLFEGSWIRIRSLRRIFAGDEITIAYINNTVDKHSRQLLLRSREFFSCSWRSACHHRADEDRSDARSM